MTDFPKKVLDKIPDDVIQAIDKMTAEELREKVVKTEALIVDADKEIEDDPKIKLLKEDLKAITGAHRDVRVGAQSIIKYCIFTLRKQGHSLK